MNIILLGGGGYGGGGDFTTNNTEGNIEGGGFEGETGGFEGGNYGAENGSLTSGGGWQGSLINQLGFRTPAIELKASKSGR